MLKQVTSLLQERSQDFLGREQTIFNFFLSRVKPKALKLVSAVTLAKRSAIKCCAEDEINRE